MQSHAAPRQPDPLREVVRLAGGPARTGDRPPPHPPYPASAVPRSASVPPGAEPPCRGPIILCRTANIAVRRCRVPTGNERSSCPTVRQPSARCCARRRPTGSPRWWRAPAPALCGRPGRGAARRPDPDRSVAGARTGRAGRRPASPSAASAASGRSSTSPRPANRPYLPLTVWGERLGVLRRGDVAALRHRTHRPSCRPSPTSWPSRCARPTRTPTATAG